MPHTISRKCRGHGRRAACIVFDYDGTLAEHPDTAPLMVELLVAHGVPAAATTLERVMDATSDFALIEELCAEPVRNSVTCAVLQLNTALLRARSRRRPGLVAAIRRLAGRAELLVYSGRDQASLEVGVALMGLSNVFREVAGATAGTAVKPSPGPLLDLLARHGVSPRQTIYIGDRESDRSLARNAGCEFLAACWLRSDLMRRRSTARCPAPEELDQAVGRMLHRIKAEAR